MISTGTLGADTWATTRIQTDDTDDADWGSFRSGKVKKNRPHGRAKFGTRPFMSWDGEGYSVWVVSPSGDTKHVHRYCLFGASNGEYITGIDLGTEECLSLLLRVRQENPDHVHVSFSFEYDVNMILRDLPKWALVRLKATGWVRWHGYRIEHRPKKWFQVSYKLRGKTVAIRIEDVFSFFSSSFVAALSEYLPELETLPTIKAGKDRRSQFGYHELEFIVRYWTMEQSAMVSLMDTFRRNLYSAGIHISNWYGPGAIATFYFNSHGVKSILARSESPEIELASRCAYAGGRFELFRCGHHDGPVYSYDINSAYPYAIAHLPNMATGQWTYTEDAYEIARAVRTMRLGYVRLAWHPPVEWMFNAIGNAMPMPVFYRSKNGNVSYPVVTENWYHFHEAAWCLAQNEDSRTLKAAWIYEDDGSYPFDWVADQYEQRLEWKRIGNPAQLGLKLGLNSFYGKMAQRIGWDKEKNLPPTWHQLDWAGFITSMCRSMLWIAMVEAYESDSLISVETDGVFTTQPLTSLPNGLGDSLGQWKEDCYEGMTAIQSGMYWLKKNGAWLQPKSRGIPRERLDHDRAIRSLRGDFDTGIIKGSHTTFVGYGKALSVSSQWDNWRTWQYSPREYAIGGDGKRVHDPGRCRQCADGMRFDEGLHTLRVGIIEGVDSHPHFLPWRGDGDNYHAEYDEDRQWSIRI